MRQTLTTRFWKKACHLGHIYDSSESVDFVVEEVMDLIGPVFDLTDFLVDNYDAISEALREFDEDLQDRFYAQIRKSL